MITPALLISACGTFIMSTSIRLGRVVDRARAISERYEDPGLPDVRRAHLDGQLGHLGRRGEILGRALAVFYLASGIFVMTSIAIAFSILFRTTYWLSVLLGLIGAGFFFYGNTLMIIEMRTALKSLREETEFHLEQARHK